MDTLALVGSEMELETSEGDDPPETRGLVSVPEFERPATGARDFLQQYRDTVQRGRASLSGRVERVPPPSAVDQLAASRGAGRTAAPQQPSRSSHGIDPPGGQDPDGSSADLAPGSSAAQRSPVISDGRHLHIISRSDKPRQTPPPPSHLHPQDVRDEDDESSEGGGQIGAMWENFSFNIDTFDALDGMRHVRTVSIQGPAYDCSDQDGGEGLLSCSVCGLVMMSTTPGYHCQECNPDYDLCTHCWMRGACTQGHKPHHLVRPMDLAAPHGAQPGRGPQEAQPPGGEHLHLPAFPVQCLEYQFFYTDGKFLMVLIPPALGKVSSFLCRVFDIEQGHHLYDIALGDCHEDPRKELGKMPCGASCYDHVNDLVWNVDTEGIKEGIKVRRWRHPWTTPLVSSSSATQEAAAVTAASTSPVQAAMRAILACLFKVAEKHARGVMEQCFQVQQVQQTWEPFCIQTLPATFAALSSLVDSCVAKDTVWATPGAGRGKQDMDTEGQPQRQLSLELLRTCMRLVVVNIVPFAAEPGENDADIVESLNKLKRNIMLIAECRPDAELQDDALLTSTVAEATNALTAGLDVFFPSAGEQATLLMKLLKNADGKTKEQQHVLTALALHLSKPAASNMIFSIFDGCWLVEGEDRMALAQELLLALLERARSCAQAHGALEGLVTATDFSESHLLDLVAAFQRHLLSIPLSSQRSNATAEALVLYYVRNLLDNALATLNDLLQDDAVRAPAAPLIRILVPPLVTTLTDNSWSQSVSTNLATEILPRLQPLMTKLDQLNSKHAKLRAQDTVFSNKGTEDRFIGGRVVSISRSKANKVTKQVRVPGAAHILMRITEDVTLTKKETLKITWEPREASDGRDKAELLIKGSQRGKQIWRSFSCPGDTITLQYTPAAPEDAKGLRHSNIRFAIYACARTSALQMPLNWLLDLELTLASLTAKLMWSSMHQVPSAPACADAEPWVTSCPLFAGGLDEQWLATHCPQLVPAVAQTKDKEQQGADESMGSAIPAAAADTAPAPWSSAAFTTFIAEYLKRHVRTPEWLCHSFFCSTAQHFVAGLIKATGMHRVADECGCTWKTEADMPQDLHYVVGTSLRITQGLIMEMRKNLQKYVSALPSQPEAGPDAMQVDEMQVEEDCAPTTSPTREAEQASVDAAKREMSRVAEEKARQMMLRCSLLMATIFENEEGMGCCVAAARHLQSADQGRYGGVGQCKADKMPLLQAGIDVASRFLTSDVPAAKIVSVAADSQRVIEDRIRTLKSMSALLQGITLSSVRQVLISTFITGPCPIESHRTVVRFNARSKLSICRQGSIESMEAEVADLFTYLASSLDTCIGTLPVNRSRIAMSHLILNAYHSLQWQLSDAEWLIRAGIIDKLSNIMVDRSTGYLVGASPAEIKDPVEHESLEGLRDEGFSVFAALTSTLARLAAKGTGTQEHADTLLGHTVEVAARLVKGASLYPSSETGDLLQLKILMWLCALVTGNHAMASLVVKNDGLRQTIVGWVIDAHSPQVQRVAMRLLSSILCTGLSGVGDSVARYLQTANGEHLVQAMLASIGAIMAAQGGLQARSKEPAANADATMRDTWAPSSPESRASKDQWMVMVWPAAPDSKLSEQERAAVQDACKGALQHVRRYQDSAAAAKTKAQHVASATAEREKACAYVGTYQECQAISQHWLCDHSIALVLKTKRPDSRDAFKDVYRWRSGDVEVSTAQQQISLLSALHQSPVLSQSVSSQLVSALSAAATRWERLAANPALHVTAEMQGDITKGLAVLETISGKVDIFMRVGSQVKLKEKSSSARKTSRGGVVVGCDHLLGTMSVLPNAVLASKSLQSVVPTTVSIGGGAGPVEVDASMHTPFLLAQHDATTVMRCLVMMYSNLQSVSNLQSSGVSALSHWSRMMQSRAVCAMSHILQHGLVEAHHTAGSGMLSMLVDHAIENSTYHDADALEVHRAHVVAALCESPDKAPTALLAAARSSGPGGGGGGPPGGPDAPSGGVGGSAGASIRGSSQRIMPSVESFIRRASQRQDQRRTRELAAAELAEISRQPLRLCQLALERENGNQDRAANWLFEHGEAFLAEHPEFAEVPDGGGEGGAGGAGASEGAETPLFLLYDAFSYYEDMQASNSLLGPETEQALPLSALASMGDLPAGMIDELRALGHIPSEDHGVRAFDERMLGGQVNLVLARARAAAIPVPSGASQRRDEPLRAGHFVTLTEMDVWGDPCSPHGTKMVGKTLYLESLDRAADPQQAKVSMYDCTTASVVTLSVPLAHVERVAYHGSPMDADLGTVDGRIKACVEVDGKLTSIYARSCLRWVLEIWPEELFDEALLGGRQRLMLLAQAAAVGDCCDMSDIPTPVSCVPKLAVDAAGGSLSSVLQRRLSALMSRQAVSEQHDAEEHGEVMELPKTKRERMLPMSETPSGDESPLGGSSRDKRRRVGLETPHESSYLSSAQASQDKEFRKDPVAHQPHTPLILFLADECLQSLKAALACTTMVEQASDHPYVRTASNTAANNRRCLHVDGVWALLVVFDARCALLPGESFRFFSDAACTDWIATAAMDDRRKGYLPLVLPSPVWMQVGSTAVNSDEGEHNWGFRVQAMPLGEPKLALALWLAQLVVSQRHTSMRGILEAVLDILDRSCSLAAPHSMQAHRLAMGMMQHMAPGVESSALLCQHPCFAKLLHEATQRQQWESKVPATAARQAPETTRCPHSTYLCSVAEMLATRALTIRRVSCELEDSPDVSGAGMPGWLKALDKAMSIVACMYCGKQLDLEGFIDEACTQYGFESLVSPAGSEEDASIILEGGQLSAAAKEALSELFHVDPHAAAHVARLLRPPQAPAHNKRDFLLQAQSLLLQNDSDRAGLIASFGLDRFLVRWGPERDGDMVALVNMLTETEEGLISPLDPAMVNTMKLTAYHQRKLPRLGTVPEVSLKRRLVLLRLLNQNFDKCLVAIDFTRRSCPSSFAASVCELQHLFFHQTKVSLHNAVIEWTTCAQPRAGASALSLLTSEVLVHRPGRRARVDNKEKAEDHERWRLQISTLSGVKETLEEFLVAPSDFGSAREMPADAAISARLVPADPPNGAVALRNAEEMRGNIALIERGGGQFVNVVRRAQEAGAIGVVMADSKQGPLFLMSTEPGTPHASAHHHRSR
jgi:hypothetical protein